MKRTTLAVAPAATRLVAGWTALGCLVALLAPVPGAAQTRELGGKGELLDRIAVIVNDGVVLQSQIDEQVTAVTERLSWVTGTIRL